MDVLCEVDSAERAFESFAVLECISRAEVEASLGRVGLGHWLSHALGMPVNP